MEYHEIGERFNHYGIVLEVVESKSCKNCFFLYKYRCTTGVPSYCLSGRKDGKQVIYKYAGHQTVEQCKSKDMEHKTEIKVEGTNKTFATQVTNIQSDEEIYGSLLDKLFTTYKAKDADYGSAFAEMFDELGIDYAYGKLREKMNRIKVLRKQPNMVENEGLEDALLDTAGYAILTLVELKKRKGNDKSE